MKNEAAQFSSTRTNDALDERRSSPRASLSVRSSREELAIPLTAAAADARVHSGCLLGTVRYSCRSYFCSLMGATRFRLGPGTLSCMPRQSGGRVTNPAPKHKRRHSVCARCLIKAVRHPAFRLRGPTWRRSAGWPVTSASGAAGEIEQGLAQAGSRSSEPARAKV